MARAVQEFDVRNAAGRRRHMTNGFAASVVTAGILSIPAASVRAVCINGWKPPACTATSGLSILIGTCKTNRAVALAE